MATFNNLDNQYYCYDFDSNIFYIYPFFNMYDFNNIYAGSWRWWIIVINPLFPFIYLFHIASSNYYYTNSYFIYNGTSFHSDKLMVKIDYFHMELWSGYFWFMIYSYLYMVWLLILKIFVDFIYYSKKNK